MPFTFPGIISTTATLDIIMASKPPLGKGGPACQPGDCPCENSRRSYASVLNSTSATSRSREVARSYSARSKKPRARQGGRHRMAAARRLDQRTTQRRVVSGKARNRCVVTSNRNATTAATSAAGLQLHPRATARQQERHADAAVGRVSRSQWPQERLRLLAILRTLSALAFEARCRPASGTQAWREDVRRLGGIHDSGP
jgi:hypothetical protein